MSKAVTFEEFCKRYKLDSADYASADEYAKYLKSLEKANQTISEQAAKDVIEKMKKS